MTARYRIRLLAAVFAFAIVGAACSESGSTSTSATQSTSTTTGAQGEPAPTLQFQTFAGDTVSLATYQGKPVVLNFWASWCPSCVAEMSAAFRPVEKDLGDEITFLGMNIQDDRALADSLLEETGVEWVSVEDPRGDLYVELGGLAMPFTVYISADGRVLDKHNGPLTEGQLRAQIAEVFG